MHGSGAPSMMASNNDATVRVFDCQTFAVTNRHHYPWPVNVRNPPTHIPEQHKQCAYIEVCLWVNSTRQ